MDYWRSTSSAPSHAECKCSASRPPWEQREANPVPYLPANSPPLTQTEWQALPSLWAARESKPAERSQSRPDIRRCRQESVSSFQTKGSSPEDIMYGGAINTPKTSPAAGATPPLVPFQSPRVPPSPYPAYHAVPVSAPVPPSPPDSGRFSDSSTKSSPWMPPDQSLNHRIQHSPYHQLYPYEHSPPLPKQGGEIVALPGTMSARGPAPSVSDVHPSPDEIPHGHSNPEPRRPARLLQQQDRLPGEVVVDPGAKEPAVRSPRGFGAKFKLAIRDLFRREPMDESAFERIEGDKHWSDEP